MRLRSPVRSGGRWLLIFTILLAGAAVLTAGIPSRVRPLWLPNPKAKTDTLKWDKRILTIRIEHGPWWTPQQEANTISGFWQWGPHLGTGRIPRLKWIAEGKADITVSFVPSTSLARNQLGKTTWIYNHQGIIASAKILLAVDPPSHNSSEAHAASVAAHELGHALGIVAHSQDPEDLMYFASGTNALDLHAINTVRDIYAK